MWHMVLQYLRHPQDMNGENSVMQIALFWFQKDGTFYKKSEKKYLKFTLQKKTWRNLEGMILAL